MCTGSCAKCLGITLIPLAILCVLCNILLFFPGGKIVDSEKITDEVWYFAGIFGSGILVRELLLEFCVLLYGVDLKYIKKNYK